MTKNATIKMLTKEYLSTLDVSVIKNESDLDLVEEELLTKTQEAFDEHNAVCDKNKKWKNPDTLSVYQTSEVMQKVFTIKNVSFSDVEIKKTNTLTCIYINDLVIRLMKNKDRDLSDSKGLFSPDETIIKEIASIINVESTYQFIENLLDKIRNSSACVQRCPNPDLIPVGNGVFDYKTKNLLAFDSELVFMSKSPINYNPMAVNKVFINPDGTTWDYENWLSTLSDDDEVVEVLKLIPSCLLRVNVRWNRALFLLGNNGNNGKSTLLNCWRNLLGKSAWCSIPLADFSKEFRLEPLIHSQAVIVDENDTSDFISKVGNLKAVITNDVIQINRKFKEAITFQFKGFMVQALNDTPKFNDLSESWYRRQLYLPMTKCFTGKENSAIKEVYLCDTGTLEYIMKIALESNFDKLPTPACSTELLGDIKIQADSVRELWYFARTELVWDLVPFTFLYALYKARYAKNYPGGHPVSYKRFINDLVNIIRTDNDDMWYCKGTTSNDKIATSTRMSKPEPLILEYQLGDWMNKNHKGNNTDQICMPVLKSNYNGLLRIGK